jgi:DNA-binding response OmpR family regulator
MISLKGSIHIFLEQARVWPWGLQRSQLTLGSQYRSGDIMPKILIVDDDVELCTALQVHLEKEHHRVLIVNDGATALQVAEEETPHLILLDLAIPKMDGIGVLHRLKRSMYAWNIPIMVVTAQGDLDDRERTLRMGAARYLQKPLSPKDLAWEIRGLLGSMASACGS